jgi:hypothetical protein
MLNAGQYCIETVASGLTTRNNSWHECARSCALRGRRLCSADELTMAMYTGIVAGNDSNVNGSFLSFTSSIGQNASYMHGGMHVSLNLAQGWGETYVGVYQYGTWAHIGRLCCASR